MVSQSEFFSNVLPAPLSFENVGDTASGIVTAIDFQEQRDFNDKSRAATDANGNVLHVMVVTLETEDGPAAWFVQNASKSALFRALKREGKTELSVGDAVNVTHTGKQGRTKLYTVTVDTDYHTTD